MSNPPKPKGTSFTAPQWDLLCKVVSGEVRTCNERYKPALALHSAKLVHLFEGRYGNCDIRPTDEGRAIVEAHASIPKE
jgi:hypothetical protein